MHCNLRAVDVVLDVLGFICVSHNAPAYKFNISATSFGFGDPDVLYGRPTDILTTGWYLPTFRPHYTAHELRLESAGC